MEFLVVGSFILSGTQFQVLKRNVDECQRTIHVCGREIKKHDNFTYIYRGYTCVCTYTYDIIRGHMYDIVYLHINIYTVHMYMYIYCRYVYIHTPYI